MVPRTYEAPHSVRIIQVDRDRSHIGRWWTADVSVVGDARDTAEQLLALLPERPADQKPLHGDALRRSLQEFDLVNEFTSASTPRTLDPRTLALELDALLPETRNAVYDAGNFFQVVPYFGVPSPAHFKATTDFSSIGMGLGTALGFARARPGETTVLFIGDGGLLMTLGELETVVPEDIPLVIVLMYDCAYGAELHYLTTKSASGFSPATADRPHGECSVTGAPGFIGSSTSPVVSPRRPAHPPVHPLTTAPGR